MSRCLRWVVAAALPTLLTGPAAAEGGDYAPDASSWNGIGYLLQTAEEADVEAEVVERLDLGELRSGDTVLWLQPRTAPPVNELLAFVRDGGHLVVADEGGGAGALLEALGMHLRDPPPLDDLERYRGVEGLPVLRPRSEGVLFFDVERVVANHPHVLVGSGRPRLSIGDAGALIRQRRLGRGSVVALADPSILLNEMLWRFHDHKQLAANLLRLHCRGERCGVRILLPDSRIEGTYPGGMAGMGRLSVLVRKLVTWIERALEALERLLARPAAKGVLGALALLLALAGLQRARQRAHTPVLAVAGPEASPVRQEARGFEAQQEEADFSEPARVLLQEGERLRALPAAHHLLGEAEPGEGAPATERRAMLRQALLRIRREADSFRDSEHSAVSAERFLRLLSDVRTLSRHLEQPRHGAERSEPVDGGGRSGSR